MTATDSERLPVVLLHGLGGAGDIWRGQVARLAAAGFRPLALDLPGYGGRARVAQFTFAALAASAALTTDTYVFSNSYYRELLAHAKGVLRLNTDDALLQDPELMYYVTLYAADETTFFADFAAALYKLTWLGNEQPA